ncbi:DUF4355 domain-containing protein [Paenibacillus alvei]|uniref:DUF4355 domain-containing protein n=1 Tax=Paenibacillus alvei TaxID=44250 RepID=UPI00228275DD|nr:DUF4355 domain-containing protein [Paenibacillus alvei]MCY7486037.1 DUF4355 domain-containing protein [Paenibacillus alvei]
MKVNDPYKYKLNLQMFADGDNSDDNKGDEGQQSQSTEGDGNKSGKDGQKFFTQDEMDRIISERLKRQQDKIRSEVDKEYRLKNMSKEEREREEFKQLQQEMEQYKRKAKQAEMTQYAQDTLRTYGIPTEFARYVRGDDEDNTIDNIKNFKTAWDAALAAEVAKRIDGGTPTKPTTQTNTEIDPMAAAFDRGFSF